MKHARRSSHRAKRYHFHVFDGTRWFQDGTGVEITLHQTVTEVAYEHIRDIRVSQPNELEWGRWVLRVDDAKQKTILRVNFNFEVIEGKSFH